MKSILFISLFFISFLSACSDSKEQAGPLTDENGVVQNPETGIWQNEVDELPLDIVLQKSIDLAAIDEPVITSVGSLSFDDDGNLYFYDRNLGQLISLDPDGALRWVTGQQGRGPGDFENPFGLEVLGERIYVANIQGTRIDTFDLNGNFIKSYDVGSGVRFGSLIGLREDTTLVLGAPAFGSIGGEVVTVKLTDADSVQIMGRFKVVESDDEQYSRASVMGSTLVTDDEIWYSYSIDNRHQVYDYEGNKIREIARAFDKPLGPGVYSEEGSVMIYTLGRLGAVRTLQDGSYLVRVQYPTNIDDPNEFVKRAATTENAEDPEYAYTLDLYNAKGELLYVSTDQELIRSVGSLGYMDKQGNYYSWFADEQLLKKYRITMPDKVNENDFIRQGVIESRP